MQYALFEDTCNQASVATKPAPSGGKTRRVKARLAPSAAMDAGLGGFATATGRSGRRYVFSKTTVEQAMLYDKALFAVGDIDGGEMTIDNDALALRFDMKPKGADLFVHILGGEDQDSERVLIDLGEDG